MRFFIIHGSFGHPGENWFPWLKQELEKLGHEVFVPKLPTPEGQSLEAWMDILNEYDLDDAVWIAHSVGPAFIFHILEKHKAKAAFLVSGFLGALGDETFDKINATFLKDFDWEKIKSNCPKFMVFHGDNDPYVPVSEGEKIAKNLGVEMILVQGAGHFNEKAGYTKFPLLLDGIKENLE